MNQSTLNQQDVKVDFKIVLEMIDKFLVWLNKNGLVSHDQYDFWSTSYGKLAKRVYYKNHIFGAPLITPIFLLEFLLPQTRKLFVKTSRFPIVDAHFIMGYVNLFEITNDRKFLNKAIYVANELLSVSIPGYSGYCWGYPFDWQTNRGLWKKNTPLITNVPYCFEAFLYLYDVTRYRKYYDIAYSISRFASDDLNETFISDESSACSYSPLDNSMVINANTYRAFLLMEAYHRFEVAEYKAKAEKNINFVLENQRPDGSWLYAIGNPQDAFVDNFHTCFVLKNLYKANIHLKSGKITEAILKGYKFYRKNLFTDNDIPKPFAEVKRVQLVKIEMYDYAEGISLGVLLKDLIPESFELTQKLTNDVCSHYQLPDGHFLTRVSMGGLRNTVPYLRWPQAQMFYAFTEMLKT